MYTASFKSGRKHSFHYFWLRYGLAVIVVLSVFLSHKGRVSGDGEVRWEALHALMQEGRLTQDKYSLAQPLLATPLYLIGWSLDGFKKTKGNESKNIKRAVGRFNQVVALAIIALCGFVLTRYSGLSRCEVAWATFFLLFGSLLLPHSRDFYSEPIWTALSLLAIWAIASSDNPHERHLTSAKRVCAIICIALTIPLNPLLAPVWITTSGLVVTGVSLKSLMVNAKMDQRLSLFKEALIVFAGVLMGLLLTGLENLIRRGDPLSFGYPGEGFTTPFWHGFLGQLFAPARGVLFFIPVFIIGSWVFRQNVWLNCSPEVRRLLSFGYLFCALIVIAYSKWHAWHGAWYWGPRFLLPLSIFGSMACIQLFKMKSDRFVWKAGLLFVALIGIMTQQVGFGVGHQPLMDCLEADLLTDICYWQWEYTPLASWLKKDHLGKIAENRTIPVMLGSLFLLVIWTRANNRIKHTFEN